jgi:hypothetical protein
MRPLPAFEPPKRLCAFGPGLPIPDRVPSPWSFTTSTVSYAPGPAGLLRPAYGLGVRRVSDLVIPRSLPAEAVRIAHPAREPDSQNRLGPRGLSRNAVTLRRVPLVSSRAASLRPLPSCRCRSESVLWFAEANLHIVSARRGRSCLRPVPVSPGARPGGIGISVAGKSPPRALLREQPASRPCSTDESVVAIAPLPA